AGGGVVRGDAGVCVAAGQRGGLRLPHELPARQSPRDHLRTLALGAPRRLTHPFGRALSRETRSLCPPRRLFYSSGRGPAFPAARTWPTPRRFVGRRGHPASAGEVPWRGDCPCRRVKELSRRQGQSPLRGTVPKSERADLGSALQLADERHRQTGIPRVRTDPPARVGPARLPRLLPLRGPSPGPHVP